MKKQKCPEDSDSGGSDSDPMGDDLDERELEKLHGNMVYIIENFKDRESKPVKIKEPKPKPKRAVKAPSQSYAQPSLAHVMKKKGVDSYMQTTNNTVNRVKAIRRKQKKAKKDLERTAKNPPKYKISKKKQTNPQALNMRQLHIGVGEIKSKNAIILAPQEMLL